MKRLFSVGDILLSSEIEEYSEGRPQLAKFIKKCVLRHACGDWSDMEEDEIEMNENALKEGKTITSRYNTPKEINVDWEEYIWLITDPERTSTLVMFGTEYDG